MTDDETPSPTAPAAPDGTAAGWERLWAAVARFADEAPERAAELRSDALAVLNGAVGDRLAASASDLALPFELFADRSPLARGADLARTLPQPSPHVVVLVHGLMANERSWRLGKGPDFGARLQADLGVTPLYAQYNSGRHVSESGRDLAALLDDVLGRWPVALESVTLVGHSMGGLVSRSAVHYAAGAWRGALRRMFLLGVPGRGAPLEQLVNVATNTLRVIPNPWTILIAWALNQRSAGIKDLRHGYLVDEEWQEREADALSFARRYPLPLAEGVRHYVLAGTLPRDAEHPLATILGDALVTPWSARDERVTGEGAANLTRFRVFPGVAHPALAWNDDVYAQILAWWREDA